MIVERMKSILLPALLALSANCAANSQVEIRSIFDINQIFCAIKTNGVTGQDNRYSAATGRGVGTSSTNSMLVLENGENDITLEVGALGWFSEKPLSPSSREAFNPDAHCKVSLTLFKGAERKVLTEFIVSPGSDGILHAVISGDNKREVLTEKITATQVEKGHLEERYVIKNYFPADMTLYKFTQKVSVSGIPQWRWVNATPFTGKPQQVQALQAAYEDLWRLFAARDNAAIKQNMTELLNAWTRATSSSREELYNNHRFVDGFKNPGFEMIPINWDDYTVEVMNKGRLVRFVNKSDPTVYPLSYYVTGDDGKRKMRWFTPLFSLVDGKFIPVI